LSDADPESGSSGAVPERCPTCGADIPAGRSRCPGCGRVFGADNACPHCSATAPIRPSGGGFVCAACGKPRDNLPGTVVLGGSIGGGPKAGLRTAADPGRAALAARRGTSTGLRVFGAFSIGLGVVAAVATALVIPGAAGILAALVAGAAGVGVGALSLRAGARQSDAADEKELVALEHRILDLAEKSDGDLTVTEVARELGLSTAKAEQALTAIADGTRVDMEIDPDGVIHYVFRELRKSMAPAQRVRVAEGGPTTDRAADVVEEEVPASTAADEPGASRE